MFVTRGAHEALMKAKDDQIALLKEQVSYLRHMLQPVNPRALAISAEADAILESRQDQIDSPVNAISDEVLSERDRILSGTY